MNRPLLITLALAVTGLAGAQQPTPPPAKAQASASPIMLNRVIATAGGVVITFSDLRERVVSYEQRQDFVAPKDTAGWRKFYHDVVEGMIDEEVMLARAVVEKVEVPDADVNKAVDAQIKPVRAKFSSDAEFRAELAKAGLGTEAEYRRLLADVFRRDRTQQMLIRKMREDGKIVPVNVTEKEVQEAFDRSKDNLQHKPATVTFKQIIINPKPSTKAREAARVKAESLLAEIHRGGDFERIAKRESMDAATKETGGDIGWHHRGELLPEFERWFFGLPPDQVSPVIETVQGFHILRVDRVNGAERKGRQILINWMIDSADVSRTAREADSVLVQWKAGVSFDTLAKRHHDFAGKEETGILTPYDRESLPPSYKQAFEGKKAGDFAVFPIPTSVANVPKFVIARLETASEGGAYTLTELHERIRDQLQQEGSMRRFLDQLRSKVYISTRLDSLPIPEMAAKPPIVP